MVDKIEGGYRSSSATAVAGTISVFVYTATHILVRLNLMAYHIMCIPFKEEPGKEKVKQGNLDGGCYDFNTQSSDGTKEPLKTMIEKVKTALSKGLEGDK